MLATNTTIDDKDWDEMVLTDGFSGFLDGTCLAMETYFYKHGIGLLKFKEEHPEIKEEAELLLGYELSENIKRKLKKIDYKNGKHK